MGTRPPHIKPPADLPPNPPVPLPQPVVRPETDPLGLDPVRYGDWERGGIAIDF